ncbi:sugar transferase [Listeria booriae]|uniref:Sugar transferase n=1 Tax=Listeria booriae TaxID=1552123 RepID=A0A841ZYM2_9LIST|nr:sugar transferase [Listeria booriae]MBC1565092.1 sugar transferase [Listeria booriae]
MYRHLKRVVDFIGACGCLIFLLIPGILISVMLLITQKKVFFKQSRVGENEHIFLIYKFQTMTDERDEFGDLLPDQFRITKLGQFLRKTSLDELPQCFNVLKGDMSFIGPRPLLVSYLEWYSEEEKKRHHVKPGMTGLAQVNGRNNISWKQKFEWDCLYVKRFSAKQDVQIFSQTIKKVLSSEDVAMSGYATTPLFEGAKKQRRSATK